MRKTLNKLNMTKKDVVIKRSYGAGKITLQISDGCRIEEELLINLEATKKLIIALQEALEQKYFAPYENWVSID